MNYNITLIAGDYWHAPGPQVHAMQAALQALDLTAEVFIDPSTVPFEQLADVDLLILAKDGADPARLDQHWLSESQEKLIEEYVLQGGRLLGFHSGLAGYRKEGAVRRVMNGHFVTHPPECDAHIRPTAPQHPVCRNIEAFLIFDEQYQLDVDPATTEVLLESSSPAHGVHIACWTHPVGNGRFLGLTPGHTGTVLCHPMMQRLISQSTAWLLGITR